VNPILASKRFGKKDQEPKFHVETAHTIKSKCLSLVLQEARRDTLVMEDFFIER
jgi:hypothetical protein